MNEQLGFGGIEKKWINTVKDYNLAQALPTDPIPETYLPNYSSIPVEMQGKTPTCGAHAYSFFKAVQEFIETGIVQRFSPRYSWIKIKQRDGYPIALDVGTDSNGIMKASTECGACDFDLLGDDISLPFYTYSNPAYVTQAMDDNAQPRIGGSYAFIKNPTFYQIKQAIYQNKVAILTLRLGEEFWTPSWAEKDILPLRPPKNVVSAHYVTAYAYDANYIYFRNSWSSDWGRNGDGYFGENYVPFVAEVCTEVDLSDAYVKKLVTQRNLLQQLVILYKKLLGIK